MNKCFFPLSAAVLCTNCENVSNSGNDHCEACGSPGIGLLPLARILNAEPWQPEKGEKPLWKVRGA